MFTLNPVEVFTEKDQLKIKNLGIDIENKIYTSEECRKMENQIEENIMSASKKNIPELTNSFRNILDILVNAQKDI